MNPAELERCMQAFGDALALPEGARQGCIDAACGGDPELSRKVRGLLGTHARAGEFLEPPPISRAVPARLLTGAAEGGRREGAVVGGRYRLGERIGSGAIGEVHAAEDLLTGEKVACKVLRHALVEHGLRSEIAALRLLRIPGVVRMIDEGIEGDTPYLVMELVTGAPFPGVALPAPWRSVAGTAVALLETLDRIHQAGFVHRDLKPGNVLVDAEGRPTVLDLGLALHPGRPCADEGIVGTPNYLAPEQLRGERATPASDLFAFGVMLHEALTGDLPRRSCRFGEAGVQCAPPGPRESVADCPAAVADLVARLLKPDAEDRPRTAAEALRFLEGASPRRSPGRLPWLGDDAIVRAVVAAAERGESVDVCGGPGSGRTRCIEEAAGRLERTGRTILRFRQGQGFGCILDAAESAVLGSVDEAKAVARARLEQLFGEGAVAFADDWERIEPWVRDVLSECRGRGTVVRVLDGTAEGAISPTPLSRADLMDLFRGPDPVFHLREHAAEAILAKSQGRPAAVAAEASAWVHAGFARWEGGRLAVSRDGLDRLHGGSIDEPQRAGGRDLRGLSADLRRIAAVVQLAGAQATPEGLAPVVRLPAWQIDARLSDLAAAGIVRYAPPGPAAPTAPLDVLSALDQEEVRDAHAKLAATLPPGDEERLGHIVGARDMDAVPAEVRLRAQRLMDEGRCGRAISLLGEAVGAVRDDPSGAPFAEVLEDLLLAGLRASSAGCFDRVVYEVEMCPEPAPRLGKLADLARSALGLLRGVWERSLVSAESMEPFPDARLELARQTVRVLAARRGGIARERAAIDSASAWASTCGLPEARRALVSWLAWLRYNEGRFAEAADLHERAAGMARDPATRASSLASRVTALMDGQRLDEARRAVREALDAVALIRDPALEARLLCMERSVEYRLGIADRPDPDLPCIIGQADVRDLEAFASLTEAAIAWRAGRSDEARSLASRSARLYMALGMEHFACLPDALRLTCSRSPEPAEARSIARRIASCPLPGLAVQAAGLLAMAVPDLSLALPTPDAWLQALPRPTWAVRREVLSVEEALYRRVERRGEDGSADGAREFHGEAAADDLRPQQPA